MEDVEIEEAFRIGVAHHEAGRLSEAGTWYRRALAGAPSHVGALSLLGALSYQEGLHDAAVDCFYRLTRLTPVVTRYWMQLSRSLQALTRYEEAEACIREVIRLKPRSAEGYAALGAVLMLQGSMTDAEGAFRAAIRLRPEHAPAHVNLALLLLCVGRYLEAWPELEWRWQMQKLLLPRAPAWFGNIKQPRWCGEPVGDRGVLLICEQGFGDSLQFSRYIPLVARRGRVVVRTPPELHELFLQFKRLPNVAAIIETSDPLPDVATYCPLFSLPGVFGTTVESVPARIPYLYADSSRAAYWRTRLDGLTGLRVGLAWSGAPRLDIPFARDIDRIRSVSLCELATLGAVQNVSFVSLQKGAAAAEIPKVRSSFVVHDWTGELSDFADTAALIAGLDLVISVDTAVVHLAGALGKPTWLLNRYESCWRWRHGRWYPTVHQFRQPKPGDWRAPVSRMQAALQERATAGTSG